LPEAVRRGALSEITRLHAVALETLARRAFSREEVRLIHASAADAQRSAEELRRATP